MTFHEQKKLDEDEWLDLVEDGVLTNAVDRLKPPERRGRSSRVICDGEGFLKTPAVRKAYRKEKIQLWQVPAKSPDLNPVELFWSWLRKRLSKLDSSDLLAGRPVLTKAEYTERVRKLVRSAAAQRVAKNVFLGLQKTCRKVVLENEGQHSGR